MQNEITTLDKKVAEFISENNLINAGEKILLTVSGGLDSVVMAHIFSKLKNNFAIAHCNFSLRGKESDDDCKFVSELAGKLNAPFHFFKFNTKEFALKNKYSIQEAARILRYKWFEELRLEFNYDKIATAHHHDDSIETFFINLMRGTGYAGLKGIAVMNKHIIRPLLFASRKEIEEYASIHGIIHREDSSNSGDDYLRNRIRHHLIPFFKSESEDFESNMKNMMEDFSMIGEIIELKISEWKNEHLKINENGNKMIPVEEILKEKNPAAFLSLILYSENIKSIDCRKLLNASASGKIFQNGDNILLFDRDFIIIKKGSQDEIEPVIISKLPANIQSGDQKITLYENNFNNKSVVSNKGFIQQIDAEKIKMPLTLRKWERGDYFYPLGMKGKKKISDFYTDEKIDRFKKDKIYLLLSGRDIVCILGHRIDERYKITSSTKKILSIEISDK
jgi:tRNA(Ile)-lysidine synthase